MMSVAVLVGREHTEKTNDRIKNQIDPYLPKSFNEHERSKILKDCRARRFRNVTEVFVFPLVRYILGIP
jgi:hypothetical protein